MYVSCFLHCFIDYFMLNNFHPLFYNIILVYTTNIYKQVYLDRDLNSKTDSRFIKSNLKLLMI